MKALYDLKEILEDEVKSMTKKGDITPQELENAYKITDILKDIETIKAMKEAGEQGQYSRAYDYARDGGSYDGGYSQRMYYDNQGMNSRDYSQARRGRDGDGDGKYSEDNSYARDRDAMGRYTSRDGGSYGSYDYSRHDNKEQMIAKLNQMMQSAGSDKEREAIRQCISKLEG